MTELELEGYTLGQKHQHYNKLVQDAIISNKSMDFKDVQSENSDIINLINIDIASYKKNVEYILKVFTCDDMLYVSRAIAQSNWLISDPNYAHIINPKHLSTNIFPQMNTKAVIKLTKYIRSNLKDEKRAEEFYCFEENPKEAVKWLPHCSLQFIEDKLKTNVQHLGTTLLRRLCEKSITVLEIYIKNVEVHYRNDILQSNMFLLSTNTDKYLDVVESVSDYLRPNFNKKATKSLMKNYSARITNKIEIYYNSIHLPTFVMCLKKENIKDFLLTQAQKSEQHNLYRLFNLTRLMIFIESMPREIRYEFVKLVFIDKKHLDPKEYCLIPEQERKGMNILYATTCKQYRYYDHIWYQFAPYDVAFQKLTELIWTVTSTDEKTSILGVLLKSAQHNSNHERDFLEYMRDKQKKAENIVKEYVLKKVLSSFNFLKYDHSTWMVLEDIFKALDVYDESKKQDEKIIEAIVLYKVIHGEKVPEIVENKFNFSTLVRYHKKLSEKDKDKVFKYLYDLIKAKLGKCNATNETEFKDNISTLEQVLNLLKDFKQDLDKYPDLVYNIKSLIKMNNIRSWNVNMASLFNINKTWRKYFFEESLEFCPTESVLLNALKHGPYLLENNKDAVNNILCNDKISRKHVLSKLKIYWSTTIAKHITVTYMDKLNVAGDHKASAQGLSILLPRAQLYDLIKRYAPQNAHINCDKIGEIELSVQQQFAKNMHYARPQPDPETILWFAKGDYLQYALPSLLSIFYNLNNISSRKYIPRLLDAPVSLQKHGIRLAISKVEMGELLSSFSNIWKNNKNASIRSVIFKNVYNLLCKEKDLKRIQATWELIEMFIDNLTLKEDKSIYNVLFEVESVPLSVRGRFYMKSYIFLRNLINSGSEHEELRYPFYTSFSAYSIEIMDHLQPNIIPEIICEFVDREFMKNQVNWSHDCILSVISSHLLNSTDKEIQIEKYEKILLPILKQSITLWSVEKDKKYFVRYNLASLLNKLRCDIRHHIEKKKILPCKMFSLIREVLDQSLSASENYVFLTKWKLTVSFITILDLYSPILNWEEVCMKAAIEFGNKCNDSLREDCDKYYPSIYVLFVKALKSMMADFVYENAHWSIYKGLIERGDFIQSYIATIKLFPSYPSEEEKESDELKKLFIHIRDHSEAEIRMHFYDKFQGRQKMCLKYL